MELGDESLIQSSEGKWHRRKANEKKINSRTLMQMSRLNKFEIRSMSVVCVTVSVSSADFFPSPFVSHNNLVMKDFPLF